jgi:SHS2 domain-containing protein
MDHKVNGFQAIPHTADWALAVWATDLPGLFIQAARGMYNLLGIDESILQGADVPITIRLNAMDTECLFVDFLNELLYQLETRRLAARQFSLIVNENDLGAELICGTVTDFCKEIKAATFSNLHIVEKDAGYSVTVTFDV